MKYAYPAIFTPIEDGNFDVKIPDLPGCRTFGKNLADAVFMAEDAASMCCGMQKIKKKLFQPLQNFRKSNHLILLALLQQIRMLTGGKMIPGQSKKRFLFPAG